MSPKGRSFAVDRAGVHHLRHTNKRAMTRCRRSTQHMKSDWDPTAFVTCEACRDIHNKFSPYLKPKVP